MHTFTEEAKTKWLSALESGKYKFGTEKLFRYTTNGPVLDALGVLAKEHNMLDRRGTFVITHNGQVHKASDVSLIWWNPIDKRFEFFFGLGPKTQAQIAELNDTTGKWPVSFIRKLKTDIFLP